MTIPFPAPPPDPRGPRTQSAVPRGRARTLVDNAAIARLLMRKGVITEREYLEAVAVGAEEELARLTAEVHAKTGMTNLRFG